MDSQVFQGNLARFRRHNQKLARALEKADSGDAELRIGPGGETTLSCGGILLASAYDPRGEGERLAEEMNREPADLLVAIGFSLGHHLEAYRRLNDCPILVYEPSPSRLRAALSTRRQITLLAAQGVHLAGDVRELTRLIEKHYTPGIRIRVFPHPSTLRLEPETVRECVARIRLTKETADVTAGTRVQMLKLWTRVTARNAAYIRDTPCFSELASRLPRLPVVIAAAGPSLDKQLPTLARYRDRVLIISIGQALGSLRRAGVEPHLVHVIESQPVAHQLERGGDLSDLHLVVPPDVHWTLFERQVRARFVATPAADQLGRWLAGLLGYDQWVMGGATVAQGAVGLAVALNAPTVMLIGQDLAYTGGRAYASGSAYDWVGIEIDQNGKYRRTNNERRREIMGWIPKDEVAQDVVWVEGWDGEEVPSSVSYASFIEHYRGIGEFLSSLGIRLVNCTEGGARLRPLEHEAFEVTLEGCAGDPVNAAEIIRRTHDEWSPPDADVFEGPLLRVRRALTLIESEARKGAERAKRSTGELKRTASPARHIEILRRVGRSERKVRTLLSSVPWVDALVQPEIHQSMAQLQRAAMAVPTAQQAVEESAFLFSATLEGVERARQLLERLDWGMENAVPLKRRPDPSENRMSV